LQLFPLLEISKWKKKFMIRWQIETTSEIEQQENEEGENAYQKYSTHFVL